MVILTIPQLCLHVSVSRFEAAAPLQVSAAPPIQVSAAPPPQVSAAPSLLTNHECSGDSERQA